MKVQRSGYYYSTLFNCFLQKYLKAGWRGKRFGSWSHGCCSLRSRCTCRHHVSSQKKWSACSETVHLCDWPPRHHSARHTADRSAWGCCCSCSARHASRLPPVASTTKHHHTYFTIKITNTKSRHTNKQVAVCRIPVCSINEDIYLEEETRFTKAYSKPWPL